MADGEVVQSGGLALTLTDLHVGKSISASLSSDFGGLQTRPSSIDGLVQNTNDPPTGGVMFTGSFEQGAFVEINFSNLKDDDGLGELNFQWYANGNLLLNETGNYLYLSQQLVGQLISASVSYTDGFGNDEEITLQAVSPVIDVSHDTQGTLQVLEMQSIFC